MPKHSPPHPAATAAQSSGTLLRKLLILTCLLAVWIVHHIRTNAFKIHSVAILPMTGKSADDYILLGMTDTLIGSVGNTVAVRPMSSVFKYTTGQVDPSVVGRYSRTPTPSSSALSPGRHQHPYHA